MGDRRTVTLLDYGAGNVRSVRNAIKKAGYSIIEVESAGDILQAERLVFPGVGSFRTCMERLHQLGYVDALKQYIAADRPFFGICLGMQVLFEGSEEGDAQGLGVIPGKVGKFPVSALSVPHIGWNGISVVNPDGLLQGDLPSKKYYFVHSFRAMPSEANRDWVLAVTDYGERYISAVQKGNVCAAQFHPEKSSDSGIALLKAFLSGTTGNGSSAASLADIQQHPPTVLCKRVIACLDVRSNDNGDLVVTKGDQYDVREEGAGAAKGEVRNLGKPVELAHRYYLSGADEVTFLNITSFRSCPLTDMPMLRVLEAASENVFVPITIGGGIRSFTDETGKEHSALDVAAQYFRSGADKVSIGSDAVLEAERYYAQGKTLSGTSSIESISSVYGAQAVVISVDPRRVYVADPASCPHHTIKTSRLGPNGEAYCWYQCTIRGGREGECACVCVNMCVCV
jgi:glutamine amidotransferase/cyclase